MRDCLLFCSLFVLLSFHGFSQTLEGSSINYLALGDSYTIGQSVATVDRWPNQLALQVEKEHKINFNKVDIIAHTGWRTDNLIDAIQTQKPDSSYNLVSLLIGVNNFYQGRDEEQYIREFEFLLQVSIALAGGNKDHVFVVSIPDYAYTKFGHGAQSISDNTNRYNFIGDSISKIYQVKFHNITPISRRGLSEPDLVAGDNLHPSGKQYTLWVEQIISDMDFSKILYNNKKINAGKIDYLIQKDTLEIINIKGKIEGIIFNTEGETILEFNSPTININGLDKGIYIISLKTDKGMWSKKFKVK